MSQPAAPPAGSFPKYPASWYLFGAARHLRHGPVSKRMLGRELVGYRTDNGRIVVMDARCSHLGADLGCGQIVGERIRCPFHHWEYGVDGRCAHIAGAAEIPRFARQRVYPVVERHGLVFMFNGRTPRFPLPFFFDSDPSEFVPGIPFRFVAECPWYMLAANGFDAAHFESVHDRTLTGPAVVDCPVAFARRMRYSARVAGDSIFDRLIRVFVGGSVDVSITCWGGPLILVTGFFRRARSFILIATQPIERDRTFVEVVVFAPRSRPAAVSALARPVSLWIRRLFTRGFLRDDISRLGGIRYNPQSLIENDRELIEYFKWVASLPQRSQGSQS